MTQVCSCSTDTRGDDSKAARIRAHMGLARSISRRYRGRGIPTEDLEQVAYLGLVKAVNGFDPGLGNNFLSYAVPTIRGEIRRHFRDQGWTVRPPRSIQELQARVTAAEEELWQTLGRSPRADEVADHLGEDPERVLEAVAATGCFSPASLDWAMTSEDDGGMQETLADRLGDHDRGYDEAEARSMVSPLLRELGTREKRILQLRFSEGRTQAEIGADLGVTQMQVSRLLAKMLLGLREQLTEVAS